jgi:ligand-binding SRPBCC domain-containing protein
VAAHTAPGLEVLRVVRRLAHDTRVSKVTLTTELPMAAEVAAGLARKPAVMAYVLNPVLRLYRLKVPEHIEPGTEGSARLWWFGIIPSWTHHITIKRLDPTEIYTDEHGGPVRTWRHRLIFEPIDERRCRYTDEIETDDGLRGAPTRLFIRLMFRHRHRRWHTLAQMPN